MIVEAIKLINPDAVFEVGHDSIDEITWLEGTEPIDKSTIEAKIAELQADYDSKQYQRDRSSEYPTWQEQMDMQYHDAKNGTNTWQEAIEAVKTKYPKGE